ncbi:MAG: beta-propeller domain-containing protein [Actinobacteria bacterium]|nr:beta-propeller domain-containing protein [Actinomycetota bacterium]
MKRTLTIALASVVALAGCSADRGTATVTTRSNETTSRSSVPNDKETSTTRAHSLPRTGGFGSSRLRFFDDCPALLGYLRDESLARVGPWGLGGGYYGPWGGPMFAMEDSSGGRASAATETTAAGVAAPPDYSGTNTQEVGVDEGDVVETDGTHLYIAGADGVRIVAVDSATVVNTLDVQQGNHQLLLDGTRLLVITQQYTSYQDTIVSLFDVGDVSDATLLHRSHLEGQLVASRSIDGMARLVLTAAIANRLPFVTPDRFGMNEDSAQAENERVIRESTIDQWMPRMFDEMGDGSFDEMTASLDCSSVAAPNEFSGLGISWIASIDLRGDGVPLGAAGVVSSGETVYASTSNIYVATMPWDWYFGERSGTTANDGPPPTLIHEFALGADGSANYVASGEVEGRLLNQFAMSELGGDLRVATTVDDWSNTGGINASESFVKVLRPEGTDLVTIGSVGGLGLGEQIQAVRFLGSQAYVVTFRQTDPLYVVNLTDPTAPVVTGELKIPGYSAYLHPVGEGLLLGVGQSATDTGQTTGTQLSLFDVSDPSAPKQLSVLPIGGHSDAEWDHKAFLYWPEDGTIVIPVSPFWGPCGFAVDCASNSITSPAGGVVVAQLEGTEITLRGTVQHEQRENSGCWNPLQRSMVIGDELVTIGLDQVKFSDLATLVARDSTAWGTPDQYGCYYYR